MGVPRREPQSLPRRAFRVCICKMQKKEGLIEIESMTKFKVIIEGCTYGCKDVDVKYHINRSATEL